MIVEKIKEKMHEKHYGLLLVNSPQLRLFLFLLRSIAQTVVSYPDLSSETGTMNPTVQTGTHQPPLSPSHPPAQLPRCPCPQTRRPLCSGTHSSVRGAIAPLSGCLSTILLILSPGPHHRLLGQ